MDSLFSWIGTSLLMVLIANKCNFADCYDPLDPNGNVTVKFDIHRWTSDGYVVRVTIQNYYQYRHVEKPGWKLGWSWAHKEVIWTMTGAIATKLGNCSSFNLQTAHSCSTDPAIVDLMPEAAPENQTENCCRGGSLSAWAIDRAKSVSSFEMMVGNLGGHTMAFMPQNLTFLGPGSGYTCGPLAEYPPSVSNSLDSRREEQVFRTWKSTCTYSNFLANKAPTCCVSLSTFYNPTITSCPLCSCACRPSRDATSCVGSNLLATAATYPQLDNLLQCTDHMCPVRVHWHVKSNYKEQWRVKLTVSNYNYGLNYSDWNVIVQHPGFSQSLRSYSFNSTTIHSIGDTGEVLTDDVALFWGLQYYNGELLQASQTQPGSVTTDLLLNKDPKSFTLRNGWGFPRRIYFNGENCEMALPDEFPALPNASSTHNFNILTLIFLLCVTLQLILSQ